MARALYPGGPPRWASIGGAHHAEGGPPARTLCAILKRVAARNSGIVQRTSDFQAEHFSRRAHSSANRVPRRRCWQGPELLTVRGWLCSRARYTWLLLILFLQHLRHSRARKPERPRARRRRAIDTEGYSGSW